MSIYLLFAIGFKGGVSVADHGIDLTLALSLGAGIILSAVLPIVAFMMLQVMTGLSRLDAAAVAAHYGSISIVTFVAATSVLEGSGIAAEGYMVAVAAAMEAPAILSALWLVSRGALGLSTGGVALFMVLSASASYIAVPAAMRVALPEANPSIYLTLSLGVTFPFNLTLGIPLYVAVASALTGG